MYLKALILGIVLSCAGPWASAQVSQDAIIAYNEAKASGDASQIKAASIALANAVAAEPAEPNRAFIAFEAAWALCQVDACADGKDAAALAASLPSTAEYPTAEERALLVAYIEWFNDDSRSNRNALADALVAIESSEVSLMTVTMFQNFVGAASARHSWSKTREYAESATRHFDQIKSSYPRVWGDMALVAEIAAFNQNPRRGQMENMVRIQGEYATALQGKSDEEIEAAQSLRFKMEAWELAMEAYFWSVPGMRPVSDRTLDAIRDEYPDFPGSSEYESPNAPESDEPELCAGEFDMRPRLRYPAGAARRGRYGSVIVRMELQGGDVTDVEVLAAVPSEGFASTARETISQWSWIKDDDAALPGCSMSRTNLVMPLVFQLG